MHVVVTGGAGFIGSHIVRRLVQLGHSVRAVDNLSTGRLENLEPVLRDIELYEGDINDEHLLARAMKGADWVFHEAAIASVPYSVIHPVEVATVNALGTVRVLKAAVDAGVKRVVYAASSSAYGNRSASVSEELAPRVLSPYAAAKLAGEYMLEAFAHCYPIETVGLRYFNAFGERQDPTSPYSGVVSIFSQRMLAGERPVIFGDGTTSRDYVYVGDVVQANLLAASAPAEKVNGRVFNVGRGTSLSLLELVEYLNDLLGTRLEPVFQPERPGDIRHSCADISLARELLAYEPGVPFREGLRKTLDWFRTQL